MVPREGANGTRRRKSRGPSKCFPPTMIPSSSCHSLMMISFPPWHNDRGGNASTPRSEEGEKQPTSPPSSTTTPTAAAAKDVATPTTTSSALPPTTTTAPPAPDTALYSSEDEGEKPKPPPSNPLLSVLQPGLRVEVKYLGRGEWVRAVVVDVREGGEGLKVQYDDGEVEADVSPDAVRLPGGAPLGE